MAHTKSAGAAKNVHDSNAQYLGVKKFGGEKVKIGNIIIRQRGSKFLAGAGVKLAKNYSIFALQDGIVKFTTRYKTRFDGSKRSVKVVNVVTA